MSKYIIAIDQGTTSSRAILFDEDTRVLDCKNREFNQYFPKDGWVEHNPEEIWSSVCFVVESIINENNLRAEDIASIGIANQRETTVVWDKNSGKPIYNAIVWQDRRTSKICGNYNGSQEDIHLKTGLIIDPYFSATKVKWILENVEGAKRRAKNGDLLFGTIDSFLIWRLTEGKMHKTDATNASRTMLFNICEGSWDNDLLTLFDIPSCILPSVENSSTNFGNTNLFNGKIRIGGVAGDQQAALIGQACFEKGDIKSTYGTGCFVLINTGKDLVMSKNKLLSTIAYKLDNKITYGLEGSIFVAGSAIQWLRDEMKFFAQAKDSEAFVKKSKDNNNIYVIPAFTGLGAPYWDPEARGAIFGITRDTSREDITKATIESVAFLTKDLFEAMATDNASLKNLKVDGGMVSNTWFCQTLANELGSDVFRPSNVETTSLGVAYLAGLEAGLFSSLEDLKNNEDGQTFSPKVSNGKYEEWKKKLYKVLEN
tara:strand:- start:42924 stop:44378 length:1455 start_codon:yes stop_codon:yes gene_type:complete